MSFLIKGLIVYDNKGFPIRSLPSRVPGLEIAGYEQ
jgi:hypothetical protein